jgi:hypothetical protein
MDENEYRTARSDFVPVPCVFEKSILSSRICCSKAIKKNLAEREVVCCSATEYQLRCKNWLQLLRTKSQFALHLTKVSDGAEKFPHAKEMKVQVGGILGLAAMLEDECQGAERRTDILCDVFTVLGSCSDKYGTSFEQLPFEQIVINVASFKVRER